MHGAPRDHLCARAHEKFITDLRDEVATLRAKPVAELTDEQLAKLAEARETVFHNLMQSVQFPAHKPVPTTLRELMNFFIFPIFEGGGAQGWPGVGVSAQPLLREACCNRIAMIKKVRELTGVGLKEAKEFIEGVSELK